MAQLQFVNLRHFGQGQTVDVALPASPRQFLRQLPAARQSTLRDRNAGPAKQDNVAALELLGELDRNNKRLNAI